jgi:predicted small metal-binding protein
MPEMPKVVHCQCGVTLRALDDDGIVAAVQEHVRTVHPDMEVTREQALAMAQPDEAAN